MSATGATENDLTKGQQYLLGELSGEMRGVRSQIAALVRQRREDNERLTREHRENQAKLETITDLVASIHTPENCPAAKSFDAFRNQFRGARLLLVLIVPLVAVAISVFAVLHG